MTQLSVSTLAWILFGAFVAAALILIAVGALQLYAKIRPLNQRLEEYENLPILRAIEETQAKVALTQSHLAETDALLKRAQDALAAIALGFASLAATVALVKKTFARGAELTRTVKRIFGFAPIATRIRES